MAKHSTLTALFTDIADAIREKKESTDPIIADNFPMEIDALRTGFDYVNPDVTEIPDYAFYACEDLNSVDCYNLTSVGASAFENCTNLKSVILYDGVADVGENAFKGCDNVIIYYKGVSIPDTWHENFNPDNRPVLCGELVETWDISATEEDNVTAYICASDDEKYVLYIYGNGNMEDYRSSSLTPWYSSYGTSLTSINIIGNGITNIGSNAFRSCTSLTSITIPDSVISIGNYAFSGCSNLTSISIPDSITAIGDYAFNGCTRLVYNEYDNAYYLGNENNPYVILINAKNKGITSCNIHSNTKIINHYAFNFKIDYTWYACSKLTSITIPDSVISIGIEAFRNCYGLTSITIGSSVTTISTSAFAGCSNLTSISIPDSVTTIGNYAFDGCSDLTFIFIGSGVINIGELVFRNCRNILNLVVDESNDVYHSVNNCLINTEDKTLIQGCRNSIIPADDSVINIGYAAFFNCTNLTSISIPDSVTSISTYAFGGCNGLTSVNIPDSVTNIDGYAFSYCTNLTSITISNSVTNIGGYAFSNCTSLTSIFYTGTVK